MELRQSLGFAYILVIMISWLRTRWKVDHHRGSPFVDVRVDEEQSLFENPPSARYTSLLLNRMQQSIGCLKECSRKKGTEIKLKFWFWQFIVPEPLRTFKQYANNALPASGDRIERKQLKSSSNIGFGISLYQADFEH